MKFCPRCKTEYADNVGFCTRDGSLLQARAFRAAGMQLSSLPVTALGSTALNTPAAEVDVLPGEEPTTTIALATDTIPAPRTSSGGQLAPLPSLTPPLKPRLQEPARTEGDAFGDVPTVATRSALHDEPAPVDEHAAVEVDLTGRTVAGRYRLMKKLGEGGMGVVYAAVDERLEKQVAMKILRDDFARRPDVVARFTQEAKSAARIKHENVLDVTDYGRTEAGSFYIAMELLVGTDLADELQRPGAITFDRALEITVQICRALGAAHAMGVVHRDLKPENVFLTRASDGREVVKIVDFGIAHIKEAGPDAGARKLTRTGMIFGTPEYMAPEQAAGKAIDHRVDVYATGVILYEMFAGRVPFMGDTFMGVLMMHMQNEVPPVRELNPESPVTPEVEAVIHKALAKSLDQRYASMHDLAEDLQRVRAGARPVAQSPYQGATAVLPPTAVGVARTIEGEAPPSRRCTVLWAVLALVLMGGVAFAAVLLSGAAGDDTTRPATRVPVPSRGPGVAPSARAIPSRAASPDAVDAGAGVAVQRVLVHFAAPNGALLHGAPAVGTDGAFDCTAPCDQSLPLGAAMHVTAQYHGRRGDEDFAVTEADQRVEVGLDERHPTTNTGHSRSDAGARSNRPCGTFDSQGLMVPCFDAHGSHR